MRYTSDLYSVDLDHMSVTLCVRLKVGCLIVLQNLHRDRVSFMLNLI